MRIAFIGLGLMGSRMAANLIDKGFTLAVYNRTQSRAEPLAARGATVAHTPRAVVTGADIVCTCVSDFAAFQQVFEGPDGIGGALGSGMTLVDFSTLSPEQLALIEQRCTGRGVAFLAAPMTGSKGGAESGTLVFMCGGAKETFDRMQPLLSALGKKAIFVGDVLAAGQVKLIGNMLIAHMMQGLSEGAALVAKAGVPLAKLLEVVQNSGYASPYWDFKAKALTTHDFATHFSIDLMHKDLSLALETGWKLGVPMPGTAAIREVYALARTQGLGDKDIAATAAVVDPSLLK
jgi:3-hydroxyisobutyrate dehydrogenase